MPAQDERPFPIGEDDLDTVEYALDFVVDRGTARDPIAEVEQLAHRIREYQNPTLPGGWRQGKTPFKVIGPNGEKFNLRVDDERAAFFEALNKQDSK